MSSIDQSKDDEVEVQDLIGLSNQSQVEIIADQFSKVSNQYAPLQNTDKSIPFTEDSKPLPCFEPYQIHMKIKKMKKKASTVPNDLPWKIVSEFSVEIAEPLSNIFNSATEAGIWPTIWKHEYVTPVPKIFPPKKPEDLRKISGSKNLSKLFENLLSEHIISDIKSNIDPAQYGNKKGLSITHYLVNMIHKILTALDSNSSSEKNAVIAQLVDWSQAFDRQDTRDTVEAFIETGLRPSLVPIISNFFQNRVMTVKWHDCMSSIRKLPGGCPQGSTIGLLGYDVNSNDNAEHIPTDLKFKFVDDLSTLELLNLLIAGLSSYNFRNHVASDIGIDQGYIPNQNLKSQDYVTKIENWTTKKKSKLNVAKSKVMIFNFNEDSQFTTRIFMEDKPLEIISESKILGTIVTTDLKWHRNTESLVRRAYSRMQILHKLNSFHVKQEDLKVIYILYIRSILEQSCQVWHFSLTEDDKSNLERVQKVALRIILQSEYLNYENALKVLNLDKLEVRRSKLCLKFAKSCVKHPIATKMFPTNKQNVYNVRNPEKFKVQHAKTSRLRDSTIPQLQRALNLDALHQKSK